MGVNLALRVTVVQKALYGFVDIDGQMHLQVLQQLSY